MSPKERILETAFILFHKQGYNSTGINQIIEDAKVAKASFYQNFKSKEDLCVEFLKKRNSYWFDQLLMFTNNGSTARTKTLLTFDFLISINENENYRGCSFLNILSEIPSDNIKILQVIQDHKYNQREYFKTILVEENLANHIYLLFESAIIESQVFKNQWAVEHAKSIVNGLIK